MPRVSQIPALDSHFIPARQFVQKVADIAVELSVHASDTNSTILCFFIQSGLYSDSNYARAQNDATELSSAFPSRSADEVCQEFLEMRLLHPDLCTLEIIQRMKDAQTDRKSSSAHVHATANDNSQFAQTQEHLLSLTQLVSQGLPDDDVTRLAAAHFPSDCGPNGRAHVFIRLIGMGFEEQRARDAAASTSSLEEALSFM
jgi:hypothetical protein